MAYDEFLADRIRHKPMKGFIFVDPEGIDKDEDLEFFISLVPEYNPQAKSSKKKAK
jgi:hypothetical protein